MRAEGSKLLRDHPKLARRARALSGCGQFWRGDAAGVSLTLDRSTGRASFGGVTRCGSVWLCPDCSRRISDARKGELDTLLAWARSEGLTPVLLTLTARHGVRDDLAALLKALGGARQRLSERREWRALGVVGTVSALEVTHGRSSWHPHFHILVMMPGGEADAVAAVGALLPVWLRTLAAFGLSGNGAALQAQGAAAAGCYVAKWGAAEEMTLNNVKRGRGAGASPWQLLEAVAASDVPRDRARASRLWAEYAAAFHGKRQLIWSRGLKARAGVGDVSDDEAAQAEGDADEPARVVLRVWLDRDAWKHARRRMVALLRAAESGGCLDGAEFGPTDAERWRERPPDALIEAA